jgi:hypothetical protein
LSLTLGYELFFVVVIALVLRCMKRKLEEIEIGVKLSLRIKEIIC